MKRIENLILLKVIGSCELLAALAMFYFFSDDMLAVIGAFVLLGLAGNSFHQAHKCYQGQYVPKKDNDK